MFKNQNDSGYFVVTIVVFTFFNVIFFDDETHDKYVTCGAGVHEQVGELVNSRL